MPVSFRPLPTLTVVCTITFAALVALGSWQLQRLQWKRQLITEVNRNIVAAPITLDAALAMGEGAQFHRVRLAGRFDNSREAYVFGTGPEGAPVFHVVVPFRLDDGRALLVDRGIVPRDLRSPAVRTRGLIGGETLQRENGVVRIGGGNAGLHVANIIAAEIDPCLEIVTAMLIGNVVHELPLRNPTAEGE